MPNRVPQPGADDAPDEQYPIEDDGICKGCDGTGERHGHLCRDCGGKGYL